MKTNRFSFIGLTPFIFMLLTATLLVQASAHAQPAPSDRSVAPSRLLEDYRKVREWRIWTFTSRDSVLGRLASTVIGVDGDRVRLREELRLRFQPLGIERQMEVSGLHFVGRDGRFLGDSIMIKVAETAETLIVKAENRHLSGFFTRGGSRIEVSQQLRASMSWEPFFVSQLEVLLATRSLKVGDRIVDSVFQSHSSQTVRVVGDVPYFMWQEIWKGKIDSVFIINLTEPETMQLFFTADKRLIRADFVDQRIRVYQDGVGMVSDSNRATEPKSPASSEPVSQTPARVQPSAPDVDPMSYPLRALLYLPLALAIGWIVVARTVLTVPALLAMTFGAIAMVCILLVQAPLQNWMLGTLMNSGESIDTDRLLLLAVVPVLAAVVLQLGGLFGVIAAYLSSKGAPSLQGFEIGALVGLGFAVGEAVFAPGSAQIIISWPVLTERVCLLLLFAATGAIFGGLIDHSLPQTTFAAGVAIFGHLIFRWLPVSVQTQIADVSFVQTLYLIVSVVVFLVALMLAKGLLGGSPKARPRRSS